MSARLWRRSWKRGCDKVSSLNGFGSRAADLDLETPTKSSVHDFFFPYSLRNPQEELASNPRWGITVKRLNSAESHSEALTLFCKTFLVHFSKQRTLKDVISLSIYLICTVAKSICIDRRIFLSIWVLLCTTSLAYAVISAGNAFCGWVVVDTRIYHAVPGFC